MIYLKTVILSLSALILFLIGFMLLTFDADYELQMVLDAFERSDYQKATRELEKMGTSLPEEEKLLYLAYIEREQKNEQAASEALQRAFQLIQNQKKHRLALEIILNRAYMAFRREDLEELTKDVQLLRESFPSNPWTLFFEGLKKQGNGRDQEALEVWTALPLEMPYNSPWMEKTFKTAFTPLWLEKRKQHSQLILGKTHLVREWLSAAKQAHPEDSELDLLLGLTYLKEAEEKPLTSSLP